MALYWQASCHSYEPHVCMRQNKESSKPCWTLAVQTDGKFTHDVGGMCWAQYRKYPLSNAKTDTRKYVQSSVQPGLCSYLSTGGRGLLGCLLCLLGILGSPD